MNKRMGSLSGILASCAGAILLASGFLGNAYAFDAATDSILQRELQTFGNMDRGNYIFPNKLINDQIGMGMSVSDEGRIQHLPDGARLIPGCRWQSCTEKAAVILSPSNRIVAAGLIHYSCHWVGKPDFKKSRHPPQDCADEPKLTIFFRKGREKPEYRPAFEAWMRMVEDGKTIPTEVALIH